MPPVRILVPLIVASALFLENLDSTILATALPAIARDFGEDPIRLKFALTSYLLSLALFVPASGWVADRFGARHVFRIAVFVFTLGSVLCGFSSSVVELVAARIVQGVGGAMMVPVGRLLVLRSVSRAELVGALAWLTAPALLGPIIGPPVGGFITTYFHWRWIFWVNVPIGILGILLATLYIPNIAAEGRRRFDFIGFVLSGVGIVTFVGSSSTIGLGVMPIWANLVLLATGALLLTAYALHARRTLAPILDLGVFRLPTFRAGVIGGSLFRVGVGASQFLLPMMFQFGFGLNAFQSGLLTFISAVGAFSVKFTVPPILKHYGFRTVLVWNALVGAVFIGVPASFAPETPHAVILMLLGAGGFFRALQFTSIGALIYADVDNRDMSAATSIMGVLQPVTLSVGISFGAMLLEAALDLRGGGALITADFVPAFLVAGLVPALSLLTFWKLTSDAGAEVSGHRVRAVSDLAPADAASPAQPPSDEPPRKPPANT